MCDTEKQAWLLWTTFTLTALEVVCPRLTSTAYQPELDIVLVQTLPYLFWFVPITAKADRKLFDSVCLWILWFLFPGTSALTEQASHTSQSGDSNVDAESELTELEFRARALESLLRAREQQMNLDEVWSVACSGPLDTRQKAFGLLCKGFFLQLKYKSISNNYICFFFVCLFMFFFFQ